MHKTIARHIAAIQSGTISKTQVIGLRKAFGGLNRRNPPYSFDDCDKALSALHKYQPRADAELHAIGVDRLQDRRYVNRWRKWQAETIAAMSQPGARFHLIGFEECGRVFTPVWRACPPEHTGLQSFDYIHPSWQSGGNGPEIV